MNAGLAPRRRYTRAVTAEHPIVGHRLALAELKRDRETDHVAHAYLFAGPVGIGKFTVAKRFAEELLAEGLEGDARAEAIRQVRRLLHADLHVLDWLWMDGTQDDLDEIAKHSNVPQEHRRKAKAKTDTISIDDVRALQERLHEVGNGRYKCCLIRSVERMQAEAVNALLKLLEEPPEGVVFLLTTESPALLLPTLISRTRLMRLSRLGDALIEPLLAGIPEEDRRFILRVAQGAPGKAKRLVSEPDRLREERQTFAEATAFWHARSLEQRLRIVSPLHDKGAEADRLLLHLSLALRDELTTFPDAAPRALFALAEGLESNASRQLLAQRFALESAAD